MNLKKPALTAPLLRIILSVSMVLIVLVAFGIWKFGYSKISEFAAHVASVSQQANASQNNLSQLQNLQKQLDAHHSTVDKAAAIVAQSQGYHYQNQVTEDLQRFANDAGVSIESYTFSNGTSSNAGASTSAPAAAPAPTSGASSSATATPGASATSGATPAPNGLKTATVTISVKGPINYMNYLRFLNDIQQNSLKMQINGLSLASDNDGLSSQTLTVQVYIQ